MIDLAAMAYIHENSLGQWSASDGTRFMGGAAQALRMVQQQNVTIIPLPHFVDSEPNVTRKSTYYINPAHVGGVTIQFVDAVAHAPLRGEAQAIIQVLLNEERLETRLNRDDAQEFLSALRYHVPTLVEYSDDPAEDAHTLALAGFEHAAINPKNVSIVSAGNDTILACFGEEGATSVRLAFQTLGCKKETLDGPHSPLKIMGTCLAARAGIGRDLGLGASFSYHADPKTITGVTDVGNNQLHIRHTKLGHGIVIYPDRATRDAAVERLQAFFPIPR